MAKICATEQKEISQREIRNQERSRRAAAQGMVLLLNNDVLPLKPGKIALYGNGARKTMKGGGGSGEVNSRSIVNVEHGLKAAGFEIMTKGWMDRYDAETEAIRAEAMEKVFAAKEEGIQAFFEAAIAVKDPAASLIKEDELVEGCSTALYVITRNSTEGLDRRVVPGDYLLEENEKENLRQLTAFYENVVVVLNVGGVIDTGFLRSQSGIGAILLMSQAGCMGGHALADVLTGRVTPSGHLTTTWADQYEDYPSAMTFGHKNGDLDDEYYTEGIYVGYRYFDTFGVAPAYPFGYGLSYTDFDVKAGAVTYSSGQVTIEVTVTNTGDTYVGREVVQVYISAPKGRMEKPYQELAAFGKTRELAPGEPQTLTLSFPVERMASYSEEKASWLLEAGTYYIRVGIHSRATHIAGALRLSRDVVTEYLSNKVILDCEMEQLSAKDAVPYTYPGEQEEKERTEIIEVSADSIPSRKAVYRRENKMIPANEAGHKITVDEVKAGTYTLDELIGQLTVEEMADLCVGTARSGWGGQAMIGSNSTLCPGAAGDTSSLLAEDRNIRNLILADGPAGLRLSTEFVTDVNGNPLPNGAKLPISGEEFMKLLMGGAMEPEIPKDARHFYQYCTAIPCATLLAQTWDMAVIEEAGDIVGEEMGEFGVTLWLAPGMNIHRNPLCGRNFEYYSEDPLVAGCCASADILGVQKHPGAGTTIKHFALNNQEDNRAHVNAHVSERTIREIYLRGFELAVRMAHPMSIMSSYNLVNGTHTANCYDLLTAVARDEWGFEGIVMTDWGTTGDVKKQAEEHKYSCSSAAACIKAGNDLIMPGSQEDLDEIICSVDASKGEVDCPIPFGDLQACAKRILNIVMQSVV